LECEFRMRLILVCSSCGYEHEVFSKLRECPRCFSRDVEVLKSREAFERGIDVKTDENPKLSRRMLILIAIGFILAIAGMGLIWLAGVFSIVGGILVVISVICMMVGVIGHWWYE